MGLFDKMVKSAKNVTGLGLNAQEEYERAYAKGVLLSPPNYNAAVKNFRDAMVKFREEGNTVMSMRAEANHHLYDLVRSEDPGKIDDVLKSLDQVPEIERLGSDREMIRTDILRSELEGIRLELRGRKTEDLMDRIDLYMQASDLYFKTRKEGFHLIEIMKFKGPIDDRVSRAYYLKAMSSYYQGLVHIATSPDRTQSLFQRALMEFKQSKFHEMDDRLEEDISKLSKRRQCWICGREMQGESYNYEYYPADVSDYTKGVVEKLEQDPGMVEREGHVTVCMPCSTMVEKQADRYATMRSGEVRDWAEVRFSQMQSEIDSLRREVNSVRFHSQH